MTEDKRPLMVTIQCFTYNQERYIRECLDGFVMQKTSFRFEAIVHDDASTDGTADIIREYAEKYPDIIKPIYEIENQYSKHDGSLERIINEHTHGKYVAVCEGDDYWTDPLKLQKQFDFMEDRPECSLCFHAHTNIYPNGKQLLFVPEIKKEYYNPIEILKFKNNIIGTNTVFYRWSLLKEEGRPEFWRTCPVGDIPMRLFFSSKGLIGFIDENMSVYRVSAIGSWTSRKKTLKTRTKHHVAIIDMYKLYDNYTNKKFHKTIVGCICELRLIIINDWLKNPLRIIKRRFG